MGRLETSFALSLGYVTDYARASLAEAKATLHKEVARYRCALCMHVAILTSFGILTRMADIAGQIFYTSRLKRYIMLIPASIEHHTSISKVR